jgi:ABC-type polysaccharide/polyol phosphate transport system ATPase subunit
VTAVEVSHLSKNYPLESSQIGRLRHLLAPDAKRYRDGLWALRDVNFAVERGEAFGIIGSNGSGKSTLLQIIAGVLRPTSGAVAVNGRLTALLELGSGFAPEFTGRQNVYLNAAVLGLSQAEVDARFAEIERFAAIGDFIDQPIRTYSSGMVLRLAFAVAAHVDAEILIVDEALAVGDIAFRQRCMRRIHDLRAQGATILFVSHDTGDVKSLCRRCVWLEKGVVRKIGEADEVVAQYLRSTIEKSSGVEKKADTIPAAPPAEQPVALAGAHRYGDGRATITGAEITDAEGGRVRLLEPRRPAVVRLTFRFNQTVPSPIAGFLLRNSRGENIFGTNTAREDYPLSELRGENTVDFHFIAPEIAPGRYFISVAVADGNIEDFAVCDYIEDAIEVEVAAGGWTGPGYMKIPCAGISVYRG